MSKTIPFLFKNTPVRVQEGENGEVLFIAYDVANILGYIKPRNAIARHCRAQTTVPKQGGGYHTLIPERDVYRLVMRSKLPEAEAFEEWVVSEVLPAIRENGSYGMQVPKSLPEALRLAAEQAEKIEQMKDAVVAYDRIATADGSLCIRDAAKNLQIRQKDLIAWLSANKWIYKRIGNTAWIAYQDKIQSGYMEHKVTTISLDDGTEKITQQARVTPKGLAKLSKVMTQDAA